MKLLIVTNSYLPKISGVAEIINELYPRLMENDPDLEINLVCGRFAQTPLEETLAGIHVKRYKNISLANQRIDIPSFNMLSILWTQIVKNKPDQIHLHSRFSIPNFFALILAKFRGIPVVHYEHLASFVSGENIFTYLCWIYDQFVSRITYFLSDQIIVVSPSCKTFIVQNLGANPNKITVNQHASKFTDPGRTYADKFTIVENWNIFFAARLVPLKNPILTLEAIKILSQKSTQKFHFNMAGDGKLRSQVEKYIEREKLQSFVSYVGYLNHEQMSSQLNSSHIFLNCSRLEGFPNTVLEAITKTNICLVSDVGGNNDLIKDQRLLIPLEKLSPESLAEKIQFIFDRYRSILPELQHEKDYVLQHYTWESAVARLEQVIHQV